MTAEKVYQPFLKLTRDMIEELEDSFRSISTTSALNGQAPTRLLHKVSKAYGLELTHKARSLADNEAYMMDLDTFLQLICGCLDNTPEWCLSEQAEVFNLFDADKDGSLETTELQRLVNQIGESAEIEDCEAQVKEFGQDHRTMVLEEWREMIDSTRGCDVCKSDA